jgi:hypothetical protein
MAVAAGLMAAAPASDGFACGYEDPVDVARGLLNWAYPDSLHVMGAISREAAGKRLPLANFNQPGRDLFGHRYLSTKKALDQFGEMLGEAPPGPSQSPVSLVLIEPMLWTRFEHDKRGMRTHVHVAGPQLGDLILVSGEAVISEVVAQRLTLGDAYTRGLVRLYGSETQIAQFLATYRHVGESGAALDTSKKPILSTASVGDRP